MGTVRRANSFTKTLRGARKNGRRGAGQQICSFCNRPGHNSRSHDPGGTLYRPKKRWRGV